MKEVSGELSAKGFNFGIVVSRFNELVTERLLDGALDVLRRTGASEEDLVVVRVPGSFEIPIAAAQLASSGRVHAVICLGALIKGETDHYDVLAAAVTRGISEVALQSQLPVTFGVITAEDTDQALNRAGIKHGNKGAEAAFAAIEMVNVKKVLMMISEE